MESGEKHKAHDIDIMEAPKLAASESENSTEYHQSDLKDVNKIAIEQERYKKAKIFNVLALIFLIMLITSVIWFVIIELNAYNEYHGSGDIVMLIFPIQILMGALALFFRGKAKEILLSSTERMVKSHPNRFITIITIVIPVTILVVGLLFFIISEIMHS